MNEDVGMCGYIDSQIETCKEINADRCTVKFERPDHWKVTIIVERKDL